MDEKTIEALKAIRQWVYFTFNYCDTKEMCEKIWGSGCFGQHFYQKLASYDFDFNRFYVELSSSHQDELAKWIMENYHGVDITNGRYEEKQ